MMPIKAEQEKQRRERRLPTHRHPYTCSHRRSRSGAADETRLAVRRGTAGRLAGRKPLRDRRPAARHQEEEKDSDSIGKLFAAYFRRAEESVLGSVLVETTILLPPPGRIRLRCSQRCRSRYKVDTDAIAVKVKQEFAAKDKAKKAASQPQSRKKAA